METNLDEDSVLLGYERFSEAVADDFQKQLMMSTIENCINGPEWPKSYYGLREEILPEIIGKEASLFFFWFSLGGNHMADFELPIINNKTKLFLNYITFNYSLKFVRAKSHNLNPIGFSSVDFTHGQNQEMFNMYLMRNDSEQFLLRLDTSDFSYLMNDTLDYFSQMVEAELIDFDKGKLPLESLINTLKESLTRLENKVSVGEEE